MSTVKPWGHFVAVVDPPAEVNDGTHNGVILPEGFGLDVLDKGIVVGIGPCVEQGEHTPDGFGVGSAVWYPHAHAGLKIGDIKFIPANNLVCWDTAPDRVEV